MTTWETTFLVEPLPDTRWDRRDLERWRRASARHSFADIAQRRSVRVGIEVDGVDERAAIATGRERVTAFFPLWRYRIQDERRPGPSAESRRLLRAGARLHFGRDEPVDRPDASEPR